MNQYELYSKALHDLYKADKPDCDFISCVVDNESQWNFMFFTDEKRMQNKKATFYIKEIVPVNSVISAFATKIQLKNGKLAYGERTGVFKILFNDGNFMYIAKWFTGIGKNRTIDSMFATEGKTWAKFLAMSKKITQRNSKPKIGVYTIHSTSRGLVYEKVDKIPNNQIFHDKLPVIKEHVNYYFDNVAKFMKYNQCGRRTILLYGEPGTSKTSTLYQIANEHKATKSVVFTTDVGALALHVAACEKYSIPTIACFEDCETVFFANDGTVKNFLSGIGAKPNKGGTCMIFTTNYPDRIEESIRERPERIDELHYIGSIKGDMLVACAKYYFGEFAPSDYDLGQVLTKPMAGAEVKLFVENTLRYCANHEREIDADSMKDVLNHYRDDLKQLNEFSKGKAGKTLAKRYSEPVPMGFVHELKDDTDD
jgi:ATPase family associated with various cellular activities (AAA)